LNSITLIMLDGDHPSCSTSTSILNSTNVYCKRHEVNKHWWSNKQITSSHLKSFNIENTRTNANGKSCPGLGQPQTCGVGEIWLVGSKSCLS